jgi:hypothetical protein
LLIYNTRLNQIHHLILATHEHGETRRGWEEFNKLTIKQKSKYPPVKIRVNPWQKKLKIEIVKT